MEAFRKRRAFRLLKSFFQTRVIPVLRSKRWILTDWTTWMSVKTVQTLSKISLNQNKAKILDATQFFVAHPLLFLNSDSVTCVPQFANVSPTVWSFKIQPHVDQGKQVVLRISCPFQASEHLPCIVFETYCLVEPNAQLSESEISFLNIQDVAMLTRCFSTVSTQTVRVDLCFWNSQEFDYDAKVEIQLVRVASLQPPSDNMIPLLQEACNAARLLFPGQLLITSRGDCFLVYKLFQHHSFLSFYIPASSVDIELQLDLQINETIEPQLDHLFNLVFQTAQRTACCLRRVVSKKDTTPPVSTDLETNGLRTNGLRTNYLETTNLRSNSLETSYLETNGLETNNLGSNSWASNECKWNSQEYDAILEKRRIRRHDQRRRLAWMSK